MSSFSRILVASFLLAGLAYGGVHNPHRRRADGEDSPQQDLSETNTDQFLSSFLSNIPDHDPTVKVSPYTTVSDPVPVTKPRVQNAESRTLITGGLLSTFASVIGGAIARFLAFIFKKKLIIAAIIVGILASLGLTATVSRDLVKVAEDVVAEHRLQKAVDGLGDDRMDPVKIAEETESLFSWILDMFNLSSWFGGGDANYKLGKDNSKELPSDPVQQSSEKKEVLAGLPGLGNVDLIGNTIATTGEDVIDNWKETNNDVNPFTVIESLNVDKGVEELPGSNGVTVGVSTVPNEQVTKTVESEDLRNGRKAAEVDTGLGEVKRMPDAVGRISDVVVLAESVTNPSIGPKIEEISLNNLEGIEGDSHVKDGMSKEQFDDGEVNNSKDLSMPGKSMLGNEETRNVDNEELRTHIVGDTEYVSYEKIPEVFENSQSQIESKVLSLPSVADQYHEGLEEYEVEGGFLASNRIQASELEPTVTGVGSDVMLSSPSDQSLNISDHPWLSDQAESSNILIVGEDKEEIVEQFVPVRSDPIVLKLMSNVESGLGEVYATEEEDDGHVGVTDGYKDLLATLRTVELELEQTTKPSNYEESSQS